MLDTTLSGSDWDGRLPGYIEKSEQMWWEVFPCIKINLPPKFFRYLGGAVESPSWETMGKVICIADTKNELRQKLGKAGSSLLNHWNCFCQRMMNEPYTVYTAGSRTKNLLTIQVWTRPILISNLEFTSRIAPPVSNVIQEQMQDPLKNCSESYLEPENRESEASVLKFKHGAWERGLDMTFRAAIWFRANQDEALARIWNIHL